jgi:hypothetical protein
MLLLTVSAFVAGCGGSDDAKPSSASLDRTAIRAVMSDLQASTAASDGKHICQQIFTPKLTASVKRSAKGGNCSHEVQRSLSPTSKLAVTAVSLTDAANGTATITESSGAVSRVFLVKQGGRWRIRSIQPV